mgnify:CR=1 FL=1
MTHEHNQGAVYPWTGSRICMSRRGGGFRRRRKHSTDKKEDACSKCDKRHFPLLTDSIRTTIKDRIKDDWNEEKMYSIQPNTCRCYNFILNDSEKSDWEGELLKANVHVGITDCNGRTRILLISNGKEAQREFRRRQDHKKREREAESKRQAEEKRVEDQERERLAEEREREEKEKDHARRMSALKKSLAKWEQEKSFPSKYHSPLDPVKLQRQSEPGGDETRMSGVFQLYVLKLKEGFYVGETAKGYPQRVFEHSVGKEYKSKITGDLHFGGDEWQQNLVSEIMDLVQPLDKKLPCRHVFEHWLQNEMLKQGFYLPKGKNTSPLFANQGESCERCNKIALEEGIEWSS